MDGLNLNFILVSSVGSPHEFFSQRVKEVGVLDFDDPDGAGSLFHTDLCRLRQTLADAISSQKEVSAATFDAHSNRDIVSDHHRSDVQTVGGNGCETKCRCGGHEHRTAHTEGIAR